MVLTDRQRHPLTWTTPAFPLSRGRSLDSLICCPPKFFGVSHCPRTPPLPHGSNEDLTRRSWRAWLGFPKLSWPLLTQDPKGALSSLPLLQAVWGREPGGSSRGVRPAGCGPMDGGSEGAQSAPTWPLPLPRHPARPWGSSSTTGTCRKQALVRHRLSSPGSPQPTVD